MSNSILGKLAKFFTKDTSAEQKVIEIAKANFIARLMKLMSENKFQEASAAINEEIKVSRFNTGSDPIIGTLRARIGLAWAAELATGDPRLGLLTGDAFTTFLMTARELFETRTTMMNSFPANPSPEQKAAFLQLAVVHQYTLFHTLKLASDMPHVNVQYLVPDWRKQGFSELNNYSGVDPFILQVCPPHHIWKKYIVDDHVYVAQDDGSIKMIPCSEFDFSKEALGTTPSPYKKPKKDKDSGR